MTFGHRRLLRRSRRSRGASSPSSAPGAQSYFSWAMRLCDFPQGIFVMALSTAALPSLATLAAQGRHERAREDVGARHAPRAVRRHPGERRARRRSASRSSSRSSSAARSTRAPRTRRRARSLAGRRDLDGGRRAPARARLLCARRHADAGRRERDRSRARSSRSRVGPARADGPRRHQHRGRRLERGADGAPARRRSSWRLGTLARRARARSSRRRRARSSPRRGGGRGVGSRRVLAGAPRARSRGRCRGSAGVRRVRASVRRGGLGAAELAGARRQSCARCPRGRLWRRGARCARRWPRRDAATAAAATCTSRRMKRRSRSRPPRRRRADSSPAPRRAEQLPPPDARRVAFAGRSNVGKSSLLNAMMQRKGLARTSSTPGCTRQLNVFEVRCRGRARAPLRRPPRLRLGAALEDRARASGRRCSRATCQSARPCARWSSSSTCGAASRTRSGSSSIPRRAAHVSEPQAAGAHPRRDEDRQADGLGAQAGAGGARDAVAAGATRAGRPSASAPSPARREELWARIRHAVLGAVGPGDAD